jgi:exosortase K
VSSLKARARLAAGRLAPWDAFFAGLGLLLALSVKAWYRHASAESLGFVLAPTIRLVELMSGFRFEREGALGYVSRAADFVVVPACAGINFLIVAFVSQVVTRVGASRTPVDKLRLMAAQALTSYVVTIFANAARITVAIALHRHRLGWGVFTPARLHELEGVVVYLTALLALTAFQGRGATTLGWALGIPLGCYLGVTILVPILDGEARGPRFLEHAALVLALVAVVAAAFALFRRRVPAQAPTGS